MTITASKTVRWTLGDEEYARLLSEEHWAIYNGKYGFRGHGKRILEIERILLEIIGEKRLNKLMDQQDSIWRYEGSARILVTKPGAYIDID